MAGNSFGQLLSVTTWGESHGGAVGVVIDGCPPRLALSPEMIQADLDRRKPGQSVITTQRAESDTVQILSGVFEGKTLGTPISLLVKNEDARSDDYLAFSQKYRPGHADFTYDKKYGIRNWQGGGRASARETIGRVAAAAVAKQVLWAATDMQILVYVKRVGPITATIDTTSLSLNQIDASIVRCPDPVAAKAMLALIAATKAQNDSIGGLVECVVRNVPVGLGEPVFDKLTADLAKACLSIPATRGIEFGSGFAGTYQLGSEQNDVFYMDNGAVRTRSNHSGGIQGGISNGQDIVLRVGFKAASTIGLEQETISTTGNNTTMAARGRHDPCVLPRAVPIVEAMVALVLADHWLRFKAQCL